MSAIKGSSLRNLVVTPERIPTFLIPHSPLMLLSPRSLRRSSGRTRLLSDHDDDTETPRSPAASNGLRFGYLPQSIKVSGRAAATGATGSNDTDLTTRAAMSLSHVDKVTTSYGFCAVLAASPCTRRRESMFHRRKRSPVQKSPDIKNPDQWLDSSPAPGSSRGMPLRPIKALGLHVIKELKRTKAARRTETR